MSVGISQYPPPDAHLLLLSCFAHLFFHPSFARGTSCIVRRFTAGEPHVWFADLLPGNLMYGSPIYANSRGERQVSFADLLPGNLMYGSPIYCRGTSCMVRRFTPILNLRFPNSAAVSCSLFACCACLDFRHVHSPLATLLPSVPVCEWGGMLAGTLVYPPGLCGFLLSV